MIVGGSDGTGDGSFEGRAVVGRGLTEGDGEGTWDGWWDGAGVAVGAGLIVGNGEGIGDTLGAAVVGDEVVGTRVGSRQHPFSVCVTSSEGSEAPAAFSATTVNVTVEKQATFSSSAKDLSLIHI